MYKIYKLVDKTNDDVYYGITTKSLKERLREHKKINKKQLSSSSIIKNGDYYIELLEETDDKSRERYYIENNPCINKEIPGRTKKEYIKDNKEWWKNYDKNWKKKRREWERSWGGDLRLNNNCLLRIDINLFS